jgi:predicted GNAT superfamily acetyltransferase
MSDYKFEWNAEGRHLYIREPKSDAEYHEIENIQREAWSFEDLDIVPAAIIVAADHAGGVTLCAFADEQMIGFAFGFPAHENGHLAIHSHMLAVRPEYRSLRAGVYLKLAQRERTLEHGIKEMSWTFDPLQSLNANLNFSRLGVISNRYFVNFYGETSSSPLHQGFGTDRLWVSWLLASDHVKERVALYDNAESKGAESKSRLSTLPEGASLLVSASGDQPEVGNLSAGLSGESGLIEIPQGITSIKARDPQTAARWREATREAFLAAIEAGFTVKDFIKIEESPSARWFYLLKR